MPVVTGLRTDKNGRRARVFLDGRYAFTIPARLAAEKNISTGVKLEADLVKQLEKAAGEAACLASAYRLLGYQARTEKELRDRLTLKGFGLEPVDYTVECLKSQKLIDDLDFACRWQESRSAYRPRSSALIRRELRAKGISQPDIETAVSSHDEYDNALRAGRHRAQRMGNLDYKTFRIRLGLFLKRRGFGYGTIQKVIDTLWQARTAGKFE